MRLLVATRATQGTVAGDEDTGVIPGEIVEPHSVCDRDLYVDTLPCGCGRLFTGVSSRAGTTTATAADITITVEQLRSIVADSHPDAEPDEADDMVADLIDYGHDLDVGTVVGIHRYELVHRAQPPR